MPARFAIAAILLLMSAPFARAAAAVDPAVERDLDHRFTKDVRPFIEKFCADCHGKEMPEAQLDLSRFRTMVSVVEDHPHWAAVAEKLSAKEMPPKDADEQPTAAARRQVIDWIKSMRRHEAQKHAGDPGVVLARRLSNAEYNYTIRDLTGQDLRPAREFPVDPANPAGFDNSGESLAMSPALLNKYLQAAREVANHLVLKVDGSIAFASHPMLVETDRDKYCVTQIVDFYKRQNTDYADYFFVAWQQKRGGVAPTVRVSPKYLATVRQALETPAEIGPLAKLQAMWRELPDDDAEGARKGCERMRDWVVELRAKLEPRFMNLSAGGVRANSQPMLMWKNRQYATHRRTFDRGALQVEGEARTTVARQPTTSEAGADNEFGPGRTEPVKNKPGDPDLVVPRGERARYEAAFEQFCSIFPDAFYVAERGRNYLDKSKDRGRYLSAGFHNVMGYFRDDQPLYELLLDDEQQNELDRMWQELDFIASGNVRTHIQFYFNESGEARGTNRESEGPRPKDLDVISERMVKELEQAYLAKARTPSTRPGISRDEAVGNVEVGVRAIEEHFSLVNDGLRWVEKARIETEPLHVASLVKFAECAYRRALSERERDELVAFYRASRNEAGLPHEEAMRDAIVSVLMSPDFCYRIDLVAAGDRIQPLSDYALASRLSYFLWSSMPDDELLARAAAGDLHEPSVLAAQARRMLKDDRARALATEFGGNWLDFRRFEELNTVDRERFTSFDNDLRAAMFEEPVRFMLDVFQHDRSVLDFVYANHTFVNPALAKHYGIPAIDGGGATATWRRVDNANEFGRGGILPMAVFLTKNAPGLRTSPVKRGYWVVKRVLGEHIPAPPAVVPELPRDEAKAELPLPAMLARHREDPSCAACHARFDSLGLVFEAYGPIGERRDKDLAGRAVDVRATFPDGSDRAGFDGLREYVRGARQDDFVDGLSRSLLAYALGRSLILPDEITVEEIRGKLEKDGYRFGTLIESIVTSPQFRTKRGGAGGAGGDGAGAAKPVAQR
jgi:hypothetical protein